MVFIEIWVYLFEAAWVVYGSTFIYSEEIYYCHKTVAEVVKEEGGDTIYYEGWEVEYVDELRITSIVVLVGGYLI